MSEWELIDVIGEVERWEIFFLPPGYQVGEGVEDVYGWMMQYT